MAATKAVVNLLPLSKDGSRADELHGQLYKRRSAALTGLAEEGVETLMTASREGWE